MDVWQQVSVTRVHQDSSLKGVLGRVHGAVEAAWSQHIAGVDRVPFQLEAGFSYFYTFDHLVHENWWHFVLWNFHWFVRVWREGTSWDSWR